MGYTVASLQEGSGFNSRPEQFLCAVFMWVPSRYLSFLPLSKDMHLRLGQLAILNLPLGVNVSVCVVVSLSLSAWRWTGCPGCILSLLKAPCNPVLGLCSRRWMNDTKTKWFMMIRDCGFMSNLLVTCWCSIVCSQWKGDWKAYLFTIVQKQLSTESCF